MSELVNKSHDELREELSASFRQLFNLRMQQGSQGAGGTFRVHMFKKVRRYIAQLKTELRRRELDVKSEKE